MAQTTTRKSSNNSPWNTSRGAATFGGSSGITAPDRSAGDLGPVSPYIRTMETRVPYMSDTMSRTDFRAIPKSEFPSPIKMGQHKKIVNESDRDYNPTTFNHTIYTADGSQTRRPNSSSFTHFHTGYLNNSLETTKHIGLVGTGDLNGNRFGSGFYRRPETTISNPRADVIRQHSANWAEHARMINDDRRETLKATDSKYRYDLITGVQRPYPIRNGVIDKAIGKRIHGEEGLGPEAPHRGSCQLHESRGRFFMPQLGGPTHHYRLDVLAREGLLLEKQSSILDLTKGELPSYGVEDQFAKSDYAAKSAGASRGLSDVKVAGLFSPRMQPLNPSGDAQLKHTWCRGVDLNCSTSLRKRQGERVFEPYQRGAPGRPRLGTFQFDEGLGTLRPVAFGGHA